MISCISGTAQDLFVPLEVEEVDVDDSSGFLNPIKPSKS